MNSKSSKEKFMLLDAYSSRTLACIRSFSKNSIPFAVGGETKCDMGLFSKFCTEKFIYTSPRISIDKFIQDINNNIRKYKIDIILPTSEAGIFACSENKNKIESKLFIPSVDEINAMFYKSEVLKIAQTLRINIPETFVLDKNNKHIIYDYELEYPVIIKSDSSEIIVGDRIINSGKTVYIYSKGELIKSCEEKFNRSDKILLQEFIDGYGVGVSGVFEKGVPVALIAHKRLRESDPLGGPSAVAECIPIDPQLLDSTSKIMKQIGYTGPAMVEYKVSRKDGTPYLMEINGRFWGTILLSLAAGLDLPYVLWKTIYGLEILPEEKLCQVGTKGRYLIGDTKSLLLTLKGKPKLWPGEFPKKWVTLKDYLALFFDPNAKNLLLSRSDPLPFFGRVLYELLPRQ